MFTFVYTLHIILTNFITAIIYIYRYIIYDNVTLL